MHRNLYLLNYTSHEEQTDLTLGSLCLPCCGIQRESYLFLFDLILEKKADITKKSGYYKSEKLRFILNKNINIIILILIQFGERFLACRVGTKNITKL